MTWGREKAGNQEGHLWRGTAPCYGIPPLERRICPWKRAVPFVQREMALVDPSESDTLVAAGPYFLFAVW